MRPKRLMQPVLIIIILLPPNSQDLPIPEGLDSRQRAAAEADWQFLLQLLDNRRVGEYEVPVPLKVGLAVGWRWGGRGTC